MLKKCTVLLLLTTLLIGIAGCGKTETSSTQTKKEPVKQKIKVGMATDAGGINDESFNASAYKGLLRAQNELGVDIKVLESKQEADYDTNMAALVHNDLTWGIGTAMSKTVEKEAKESPDRKFGIVDFAYTKDGKNVTPSNVVCVTFKEEEGSFLMGVIAAKMTKTNKVGFLGGEETDFTKRYEYGFRSGVAAVNPKIEVLSGYTASFTDSSKGKILANSMYNQGTDVIYHAAKGAAKGLFDAAQENSKDGKKVWVIGSDSDQYRLAPANTLSSMIKSVNNAVFDICKRLTKGDWKGGKVVSYGLKEGGIDIAPSTNKNTPQAVIDVVNSFKQKIVKGEIKVPNNQEQFAGYMLKLPQ